MARPTLYAGQSRACSSGRPCFPSRSHSRCWRPHLHRDRAHPAQICTGTGITPCHIGPGRLRSRRELTGPHLRRSSLAPIYAALRSPLSFPPLSMRRSIAQPPQCHIVNHEATWEGTTALAAAVAVAHAAGASAAHVRRPVEPCGNSRRTSAILDRPAGLRGTTGHCEYCEYCEYCECCEYCE